MCGVMLGTKDTMYRRDLANDIPLLNTQDSSKKNLISGHAKTANLPEILCRSIHDYMAEDI